MKWSMAFCLTWLTCLVLATAVTAQPGRGRGFRGGRGPGPHGPGPHGHDDRHDEDHEVFQFLLTQHDKIKRTVKNLPNGVETLTESEDPEISAKIQEHVEWMRYRIENTKPIRMRDPLFAELFRHTDKIVMKHEDTARGVRVVETSQDPYVVKLIQRHAEVVSGFVNRGFTEAMKNHAVPDKPRQEHEGLSFTTPVIEKYGAVVRLPTATQQPRAGSRLLVDVTRGGEADQLNSAIEKLARYVNIYSGAGKEPADLDMAVVLHGEATLAALNDDAYSQRFETGGNPNLDCLHRLHEAGVAIYVCGQTLVAKDERPEDVAVFVDVAVSALTAIVNLQADGYAYVPIGK